MRILHVLLFLNYTATLIASDFLDITKFGFEQYQDIIINNQVIKPATNNHKDCLTRYHIIQSILDQYKRPFTLLDLGASQGYYSFKAAWDYDCVAVMIEGNNRAYPLIGNQLLSLCECNNKLDNIIFLNKKIVPNDLKRLGECEHFDAVLALNIIHWFDDWQQIADYILSLGTHIIIETPPQESFLSKKLNIKRQKIENYLIKNGAQEIGKVKRHTSNTYASIYLLTREKKYLKRKVWFFDYLKETHIVESSFEKKQLIKEVNWPKGKIMTKDWFPGINLMTFKMYNGAFPLKNEIKNMISNLQTVDSNDWMPNNMVLQGKNMILIDTDDPNHTPGGHGGGRYFSQKLLSRIHHLIDLDNPSSVINFFYNSIVHLK